MKHLKRDLPPTCPAFDFDHGIERDEGHAEIGWMRSDAALAPAHYGVQSVVATARVTACTGVAFIAGTCNVVEIGAARALQEITPYRRRVPKLRRRPGQKRLRDCGKAPGEAGVASKLRIADESTDAHAAVGKLLDAVEIRQMSDIYEPPRAVTPPFIKSKRLVPAAR
jgi:hypothetical protein